MLFCYCLKRNINQRFYFFLKWKFYLKVMYFQSKTHLSWFKTKPLLLYHLICSSFVRFIDQEPIQNEILKNLILLLIVWVGGVVPLKKVSHIIFTQVCVKLHTYLFLPIFKYTIYFLLTNKNIILINVFVLLHFKFCRIILINEGMILWTRNKTKQALPSRIHVQWRYIDKIRRPSMQKIKSLHNDFYA